MQKPLTILKCYGVFWFCAVLAGCSQLVVENPFGELADAGSRHQLNGVWTGDAAGGRQAFPSTFSVHTDGNGLQAVAVSWNAATKSKPAGFTTQSLELELRSVDGVLLLFIRVKDEDPHWIVARIEVDGPDRLVVHFVNKDGLLKLATDQGAFSFKEKEKNAIEVRGDFQAFVRSLTKEKLTSVFTESLGMCRMRSIQASTAGPKL